MVSLGYQTHQVIGPNVFSVRVPEVKAGVPDVKVWHKDGYKLP